MKAQAEPGRPTRALLAYLMVTAVLSGALVMVIEVMGSRLIGPFFGVSLYVWTSLIAVTLIALACGYAVGGVLADRKGTPERLYSIILLAGFAVLLVPLAKGTVLRLCFPLGLRLGAFASASLLFGPSLFLLGCVSPYLVRIAAREMRTLGRTVGGFYALSTVGSVLGTMLTGFVLIAYLGVDRILGVTGALLIGLAVGYFAYFGRKWIALAAVAFPWLLFPAAYVPGMSRLMSSGTRVTSIAAAESIHGSIKVVDYAYETRHTRELVIDGLVQGGIDMRSGLSVYPYSYYLELIPLAIHADGAACLVIGLGAGIVPRGYERRGIRTDVVDIEPRVVDFAKRYFGFSTSGDIVIEDARYFLATARRSYDYVILDVFNGDTTPGYLLSREAISLVRRRLTERGVLGLNIVGSLGRGSLVTASVVRTLQSVFDQVEIYPTFAPDRGVGVGNLVLIAYSGPPRGFDPGRLRSVPVHWSARESVRVNLGRRFEFPESSPAFVLTDDYNPSDVYDAWVRESVRMDILNTTHWDVLIAPSY